MKKISVVIPCRNEEKHIGKCIESLLQNKTEDYDLEIIVVDGLSTDNTKNVVSHFPTENVVWLLNEKKITPVALNMGVQHATGDYILIASAHSSFDSDYISVLLAEQERLGADVVGGSMLTFIKGKTSTAKAIKEVLSCKFGVGNSMFRVGIDEITKVDTVPFGLYRKELFDEIGGYDERLVRNHDIELSKRLIAAGKSIYLIPQTHCTYYARETFGAIASNNYKNGFWNMRTIQITHTYSSLSLRHFIPLLFVLSLILPALVSIFYFPFIWLTCLSLVLYLLFLVIISGRIAIAKNVNFFLLCWAFITIHFSYGLGSFFGIFKVK